jgi:hypothetical protein
MGTTAWSRFTPARWGLASSASTVDLIKLVPGPLTPTDGHCHRTGKVWVFDLACGDLYRLQRVRPLTDSPHWVLARWALARSGFR